MSSYFLWILILSLLARKSASEDGKEIFEIESAVIRCQNPHAVDDDDFRVVNWKPRPLTSFNVPIKPGPHDPNSALDMDVENNIDLNITRMTKCVSQAVITVKIKHTGNIPFDDGGTLIKLDHFLDERSEKSVRLGNPLGIKIQEGPLFAVYPLKYIRTVNANPTEIVANYTKSKDDWRCNVGGDICGSDGKTGNFVHGFCCSCDAASYNGVRGGHQCLKNKTDLSYSTHCLHFSDYWYAIFEIGTPEIFHQVYIQVYQSEEVNGTLQWKMSGGSGKGQMAKIDPLHTTTFLDEENLSITYRKIESPHQESVDTLSSNKNFLLIPTLFYASTSKKEEKSHELYQEHPIGDESLSNLPVQFKNGIDDAVLVVPKKIVGGQCNEVGVTPESFTRQPSPCQEASGTCLRNQPFELWETDESKSTTMHYRLKHFGKVHAPAPFKRIKDKIYFAMEHERDAVGYIDIQIPADQLQVMRPGYSAQLISVLAGCSSSAGAKLIVEVANAEYVPAFYGVNVLSCTHNLPLQKSELRLIDALRVGTFQLDLHYPAGFQLHKRARCSVGILNQYNEVVAFRTVLLSPGDTCICSLNCKCACAEEPSKFGCNPLSDDEILSAGFPDPQEFMDYGDQASDFYRRDKLPYLVGIVVLILILLGILKAMVGLCGAHKISKFGLWYFENRPRKLDRYYEKEYSRLPVVYDEEGNPVDPFTKQPTVERLSWFEQFGLNTLFFLLLPLFCCWNCCCWCFWSRKLSKSESRRRQSSSSTNFLERTGEGNQIQTPQKSPQNPSRTRTPTQFVSRAEFSDQMQQDSMKTLHSKSSHISLFSRGASKNVTPFASWHKMLGSQGFPVDKGQGSKYSQPKPAPSTTMPKMKSVKSQTDPSNPTNSERNVENMSSKSTPQFQ